MSELVTMKTAALDALLDANEILLNHKNLLLQIVHRTAQNTCCICCDPCLTCDAKDLLKQLGEREE